jgi:hypothetical protein
VKLVLALRRSEKLPMIDDVELGTLADTDRAPMGPGWNLRRLNGSKDTHQLLVATYFADAATAPLIDRARRADGLCNSGDTEQTMAESVFCREAN